MAVFYLKKSKMYEVLKSLGLHDISKLRDCHYKFYRGAEWLTFNCSEGYGKLGSQFGGKWFHVVVQSYEDDEIVRDDVLTDVDVISE